MKKKTLIKFGSAALILVSALVFVVLPLTTKAAFNKNNIMSDAVFSNKGTMSASQINSWLNNNFPSSCISTSSGFHGRDPNGYSPSTGFTYGNFVSAGRVIAHASKAYGLNPQVLLATLQKESSVVSGTASYGCKYLNTAMGYGCPDNGSCPTNPATMSGFSKQVIHAAWLLRFGQQRSLGNTGWNVQYNNYPRIGDHWNNSDDPPTTYGGPMTKGNRARVHGGTVSYYDGYTTIDGTSTRMGSGATAALYWYTPHFSGNQHFYTIFNNWFGTTTGSPFFRVSGTSAVYITGADGTYYHVTSPSQMAEYGYGTKTNSITAVSNSYLSGLTYAGPLSLVARFNGTAAVYMMGNKRSHYVASETLLNDYGYTFGDVSNLADWVYDYLHHSNSLANVMQLSDSPAIYYVSGGKKQHITSWAAYTTLGSPVYSSRSTVGLDSFVASQIPAGAPIMTSGTLTKNTSNNTYGVWNGSTLQTINSTVAKNTKLPIYSASSSVISQLSTGGSAVSSLAKSSANKYYILDSGKKIIVSSGQLSNLGLSGGSFIATSDSFLSRLSTKSIGTLIRINSTAPVYDIISGEIYHIPTGADFSGLGYSFSNVRNVNQTTANLFTNNGKDEFKQGRLGYDPNNKMNIGQCQVIQALVRRFVIVQPEVIF